jgi:hypothetical protein
VIFLKNLCKSIATYSFIKTNESFSGLSSSIDIGSSKKLPVAPIAFGDNDEDDK